MNGVLNAVFIVSIFLTMLVFAWIYSISDIIMDEMYAEVNSLEPNDLTDTGKDLYEDMRDFVYNALNRLLLPFLLFLALASSFINRNVGLASYLVQSMSVVLITPILVYVFADVITAMTSVTIIDSSYLFSTYTDIFLYVLVANMILSLASFVFIQKRVQYA